MPERPDLRTISGNIRDALADCDRDTLLDILTFVFKEYVVEGPPPLLVHQTERLEDLEKLSFAELITALQSRLDHPELALFQVDGDQVSVRAGGVMTPLSAPGNPAAGPGAQQPAQPAQPTPRVQVVETDVVRRPPGTASAGRSSVDEAVARGRGDLAGMAQDAAEQAERAQGAAPPPRRGVSIRGRTTGGSMMPEPAPPAAPSQDAAPPREQAASPSQDAKQQPEPEPTGDDDSASTRFSLLELD